MNRIWYAGVVILIVAAICFYEYNTINNTADTLEDELNSVLVLVENGKKQSAADKSEELKLEWEKRSKTVNCFVTHNFTDKISESIYALPAFIKDGRVSDLQVEAEHLRLLLQLLKDDIKPSLENFF